MTIYQDLKKANVPIDNHASDLYCKMTTESATIMASYKYKQNVTVFNSNITKELWYDIPFAYDPFWEAIS